eukprot:6481736-Amphidinium_carterae.1
MLVEGHPQAEHTKGSAPKRGHESVSKRHQNGCEIVSFLHEYHHITGAERRGSLPNSSSESVAAAVVGNLYIRETSGLLALHWIRF